MKVRYSRISTTGSATRTEPDVVKPIAKDRTKKIDIVPYNQRIAAAAKERNLSHAIEQWEQLLAASGIPTPHSYCAMVNAFVRCGQLSRAEEFVQKMEASIPIDGQSRQGYIITLTALLKGYFMSSEYVRSHILFPKILKVTMGKLGSRTLDTYLRGCLRTGAFEQGLSAFSDPKTEKSEMSSIYASKMHAIQLSPKSAASHNSTDPSVCIHIGASYIRLGKLDRATEWFVRAKDMLFSASTPDRQFDKMQKSEMLRSLDFFKQSVSLPLTDMISKFLFLTLQEQVTGWKSLGASKLISTDLEESVNASRETFFDSVKASPNVIVEVCSGFGEWICREASANPLSLYIAVEFRFDRCVDILTRIAFLGLKNVYIVCGDCRRLPSIIPIHSVSAVHVNYPEPPPVNTQSIEEAMSSDIVTKKFLADLALVLVPTGTVSLVSDDKLYASSVATLISDVWGVPVFPQASKTQVDSYFARFFTRKAKRYEVLAVPKRS